MRVRIARTSGADSLSLLKVSITIRSPNLGPDFVRTFNVPSLLYRGLRFYCRYFCSVFEHISHSEITIHARRDSIQISSGLIVTLSARGESAVLSLARHLRIIRDSSPATSRLFSALKLRWWALSLSGCIRITHVRQSHRHARRALVERRSLCVSSARKSGGVESFEWDNLWYRHVR